MIIMANELNKNGITREEVINTFCENLMDRICKANADGQRKICFDATVWTNKQTNEISPTYKKEWGYENNLAYEYRFDDYAEEIKKKFTNAGYVIKPTGYIGGVWQRTEDIMW